MYNLANKKEKILAQKKRLALTPKSKNRLQKYLDEIKSFESIDSLSYQKKV
jgi:hypothetical protein